MLRILTTALAALILATPVAALSQEAPSYAQPVQGGPADEQIRGRVTNFDGAYALTVSDERGFVDNVDLHDGTIINPTGLTLAPGMVVSVLGYNDGSAFAANEIDTPYSYDAGVPYYSGHPWDYYGPSIGLGFFFGNVGWWHGNDFRGGYGFVRGARSYDEARGNSAVRGDYSDRNSSRGGYSDRNGYSVNAGTSRGPGNVSAPRDAESRFDRAAAPRAQFSQRRGYEAPRQIGRPSVGREAMPRESGPRDGGHDRGGRPH